LYIGTDDAKLDHPILKSTGGGIFMCLRPDTGELIWQQVIPRYMEGTTPPFHFNHWKCGVCSKPAVEDNRIYIVSPRGEILCLDREGQANGNDGPFLDEARYLSMPAAPEAKLTAKDGDIIWQYDLIKELAVYPHDVCGNSPLLLGDYVYASTSNGVDDTHRGIPGPEAPSLIVLDKRTGRLVAADAEKIGRRLLHGQWSSPVAAVFGGRQTILFGAGDGVLYAFEPVPDAADRDTVATLKKIWQYACCPDEYWQRDGEKLLYSGWSKKTPDGPSEVIATPVIDGHRIYISIGQSPVHGPGQGMLSCVDGTTGKAIWTSKRVGRSLSDSVIHDGLLYCADYSGTLHCFVAATGEPLWDHDLESGVWSASPVVADGKVYISTENRLLWVFQAGREKKVLSRSRMRTMGITPVLYEDTLYFPTQQRLFAIKTHAPQKP
jgi:outer membrane protein assembly factor BamB